MGISAEEASAKGTAVDGSSVSMNTGLGGSGVAVRGREASRSMSHESASDGDAGAPALELRRVSKRFGTIWAVKDVSFAIHSGEVMALLGDNGAGKSTLVKMISGAIPVTSGDILVHGKRMKFSSSQAARRVGISTVYQDLGLVPTMSVWRNFFLGAEIRKGWHLDVKRMRAETEESLKEIGLRNLSSVDQNVMRMSGGEQQALSIGRAVHFEQKVLLLDEPTAALSVKETEKVFEYIRRAKEEGVAVLVIMHNTAQAVSVSDRVVVMRHGRVISERNVEGPQNVLIDVINADISGGGE
jgi:simple sugar transport system ATP-binding protein